MHDIPAAYKCQELCFFAQAKQTYGLIERWMDRQTYRKTIFKGCEDTSKKHLGQTLNRVPISRLETKISQNTVEPHSNKFQGTNISFLLWEGMGNWTKIYLSVHYNHYAPIETKTFNESSFVSSSMNEKQRNKAGYMATSCGRMGRGGYVRFPTF